MKAILAAVREYLYRLMRRKQVSAALKRELTLLRGTLK